MKCGNDIDNCSQLFYNDDSNYPTSNNTNELKLGHTLKIEPLFFVVKNSLVNLENIMNLYNDQYLYTENVKTAIVQFIHVRNKLNEDKFHNNAI